MIAPHKRYNRWISESKKTFDFGPLTKSNFHPEKMYITTEVIQMVNFI